MSGSTNFIELLRLWIPDYYTVSPICCLLPLGATLSTNGEWNFYTIIHEQKQDLLSLLA